MEKNKNTKTGIVISKVAGQGLEKTIVRITPLKFVNLFLCFAFQFSVIFSSMAPFSLAFYTASFNSDSWIICFVSSITAMIISGSTDFWKYAPCLVATTAVLTLFDTKTKHPRVRSAIVSVCFAALCGAKYAVGGVTAYDVFALILETTFMAAGTYVFSLSQSAILSVRKRSIISEAEIICIFAAVAIGVLSMNALPNVAGLTPASVMAILLIYIMCYAGSKLNALTLAILLGVMSSMQKGANPVVMGTYAFGALLASTFTRFGKPGTVLGFVVANTAASLLFSDTREIIISIYDSFAASIIFALIPKKVTDLVSALSEKTTFIRGCESVGAGHLSTDRFLQMADSFARLSQIYSSSCEERTPGKNYTASIIRSVSDKACTACSHKDRCFNEKNGRVFQMLPDLKRNKDGHISVNSLPKDFREFCHRCDSFTAAFNSASDIIRTEHKWIVKTNECKKLICRQLKGISDAIRKECGSAILQRDSHLEDKLWAELDGTEFSPANITVYSDENGDFDISVSFRDTSFPKNLRRKICEAIEKITHTPTEFGGIRKNKGTTILTFCPMGAYSASFGYATKAKSGQKVCGDSFNVIYTGKDRMIMALSDGMGSGAEALNESRTTIELLEKFLMAGFECDTSVALINSSLLLKGEKDSFATIDICDINLADATLGFTKLGAASAYIKSEGKVTGISGESLPAGIVKEAEAEKHMLAIGSDTVVVLMSDGVADIALKDKRNEGWIEKTLLSLDVTNPQIIAGKLLDTAYRLENKETHDDMTVLVAYISKTKSKV